MKLKIVYIKDSSKNYKLYVSMEPSIRVLHAPTIGKPTVFLTLLRKK